MSFDPDEWALLTYGRDHQSGELTALLFHAGHRGQGACCGRYPIKGASAAAWVQRVAAANPELFAGVTGANDLDKIRARYGRQGAVCEPDRDHDCASVLRA